MNKYEYRVIPTPAETQRKGLFRKKAAVAMDVVTEILNDQGAHGWEYVRSETLISEHRRFLRPARKISEEVMVFRRSIGAATTPEDQARLVLTDPVPLTPVQVKPRRVMNSDAVARVKAGQRRLHVHRPASAVISANAMAAMTAAE